MTLDEFLDKYIVFVGIKKLIKQGIAKTISKIELEPDCFIYDKNTDTHYLKYKIKKETLYPKVK